MQKLAKYQQTESWPNEIYSWNKRMDFNQYHILHEQSKGEEIPQNHLNAKKKKAFDKILHFHGKKKKKNSTRSRRKLSQIIKSIYEKSTANTIVICERLKSSFPLRLRTIQECLLSSLLYSRLLKILARGIMQK